MFIHFYLGGSCFGGSFAPCKVIELEQSMFVSSSSYMANSIRFGGVHIEAMNWACCRGSYYMLDVCFSSPSSEVGDIRDLKVSSLDVHVTLERILGPGQNQRGGPDIDLMCGSCRHGFYVWIVFLKSSWLDGFEGSFRYSV